MGKTYNISRVSNLLCYTIDDICNLYKNRKLHPQTIRKWINNGLVVIDNHKPLLIHGSNLKQFLGKLNEDHQLEVDFNEFYCFSCKDAHIPLNRTIYVEQRQKYVWAKALCPKTKKIMNKSFKLIDFPKLKKIFKIEPLMRLYDSLNAPLETQIGCNDLDQKNESHKLQGEFDYE